MVTGRITASGYSGGWFNRERHTEIESFIGSTTFGVGDRPTSLTRDHGCSGDLEFLVETSVQERRADGAVRVSVLIDTWDECPGHGWNDGFSQPYQWVGPGETVRVDVPVRSGNGSAVVSGTFTNYWTPKFVLGTPTVILPSQFGAQFDFQRQQAMALRGGTPAAQPRKSEINSPVNRHQRTAGMTIRTWSHDSGPNSSAAPGTTNQECDNTNADCDDAGQDE